MKKRDIIQIDEEKCNGCGLCVPACHEGAIQIIEGKAKLIDDKFCDGLGNCLGECPQNAITIIKREAEDFDEEAVAKKISEMKKNENHSCNTSCPGSKMINMRSDEDKNNMNNHNKTESQLKQWPVQLTLVPENAPYFHNAKLLVTADCVAFAYTDYHLNILKGHSVVIACPKLDNNNLYTNKLTSIITNNDIESITVAYMEVPCCSGIVRAVELALIESEKNIPLKKIKVGINGEIIYL